jgi:hypothetical protein
MLVWSKISSAMKIVFFVGKLSMVAVLESMRKTSDEDKD